MTAQTQNFQHVPLNKLVASRRNVRRKDRKVDIDALAASIASCGLLQNLCVVAGEGDRFEVDAGGRRLMALKKLAKDGVIAKDFPVPCHIVAPEDGREASLIENIHRVAMDAMDEVDAFAALVAEGATPDDIARRFGATQRHVEQRLALAALSPKLKAAWKRGDLNLDAARAFCIVEDHARQEAVFRSMGKPVTHASSVRARLMEGRMRGGDRVSQFVGLEAYEVAGGKVLRDLFDADAVFIDDPALMMRLAEEKLEGSRTAWLAEGWGWVDIDLGGGRPEGLAAMRLHPDWRDQTADEQAELDRLQADIEKLDAELDETAVEEDPRWSTRDDLEAAYETIRQQARQWDRSLIALAGVVLTVGHDGSVAATEGLVRKEDQKRIDAIRRQAASAGGDDIDGEPSGQGDEAASDQPRKGNLPKAVARDLTSARTRAIRQQVAAEPDIALAICVSSFALRSLRHADMSGVALAARGCEMDDGDGFLSRWADLDNAAPHEEIDMLRWCLSQDREALLALLAVLVGGVIDLRHEDATPVDRRRQSVADLLAQALDIDMTQVWKPGLDYWLRLSKTALIDALAQAGDHASAATAPAALLASCAKLKKDALAQKVERAWSGRGYLPDLLVTPVAAGALALTETGAYAVAAE